MRRTVPIATAAIAAAAAAMAACGRVGFDDRIAALAADAPPGDTAPAPPPSMVTTGAMNVQNATTLVVPLAAPATPNDLIVVGVTVWDGTAVAGIAASDATAFAPTTTPALLGTTSSELWFRRAASAIDSVTVTMSTQASGFDVWAIELAHVRVTAQPDAVATSCAQYPPDVARATVTTTAPNELVIGATMLQYPAYMDHVDPPFTALEALDGNGFTYAIAPTPGAYGPQLYVGAGSGMAATTCSTTAAFLPE